MVVSVVVLVAAPLVSEGRTCILHEADESIHELVHLLFFVSLEKVDLIFENLG